LEVQKMTNSNFCPSAFTRNWSQNHDYRQFVTDKPRCCSVYSSNRLLCVFISQQGKVLLYSSCFLSHLTELPNFFWSKAARAAQYINTSISHNTHKQSPTVLSYL